MKLDLGMDELTQAVRLNDSMAEIHDGFEGIGDEFGIDRDSLLYVSGQRTAMLFDSSRGISKTIMNLAALNASWLDGFFAALHAVEQHQVKDLTDPPT